MLEVQSPAILDISAWVRKARANPTLYRQRQVTGILLYAVAITPGFGQGLFLKGGILMALAYGSPRTTGDIDFSAIGDPEEVERQVIGALDASLREASRKTGHLDLICKVQRVVRKPKPATFAESPVPALEITIGSAQRTSPSEVARLEAKQSPHVVRIDLSFREPIGSVQRLIVGNDKVVQAYGLYDLLAEKMRAILQQLMRPHPGQRRQDIYDISHLLTAFDLDEQERGQILSILRRKCRERDFEPTAEMITDERIVARLRASWPTLQNELEETLPDFDKLFGAVRAFYEALPWEMASPK